jgi:hypothetical protein
MSRGAASRAWKQGPRERSEWGCDRGESTLEADDSTVGIRGDGAEAEAPRAYKEAAR